MRYGSKPLEFAKGKNAIELATEAEVDDVLAKVREAAECGECTTETSHGECMEPVSTLEASCRKANEEASQEVHHHNPKPPRPSLRARDRRGDTKPRERPNRSAKHHPASDHSVWLIRRISCCIRRCWSCRNSVQQPRTNQRHSRMH